MVKGIRKTSYEGEKIILRYCSVVGYCRVFWFVFFFLFLGVNCAQSHMLTDIERGPVCFLMTFAKTYRNSGGEIDYNVCMSVFPYVSLKLSCDLFPKLVLYYFKGINMNCIKHTFLSYLWASENIVLAMAHVKIEWSALLYSQRESKLSGFVGCVHYF